VIDLQNSKSFLFFLFKIFTFIKYGKVSIEIDNKDFLSLEFKERTLDLKLKNLEPLKLLRKALRVPAEEEDLLSRLSKVKKLAGKLKRERYTVLVTWKEEPILVIGEKARPILARIILGNSIEVKDLKALVNLLSQLK